MRRCIRILLIVSFLLCVRAFAPTDIPGIRKGKLPVSPNDSVTIRFIIMKKTDGSYTAIVNLPDTGGFQNGKAE